MTSYLAPTGAYPTFKIVTTALFLGTYPGLTQEMLDYEIQAIRGFVESKMP